MTWSGPDDGPGTRGGAALDGVGERCTGDRRLMAERSGPREPRSLLFYVTLSIVYATLTYWLIQWFYAWELASAGLLPRTYGPTEILLSTFTVHAASFLACLAMSVAAGAVAHRVQDTLVTALSASRRQAADLADVEVSLAAA